MSEEVTTKDLRRECVSLIVSNLKNKIKQDVKQEIMPEIEILMKKMTSEIKEDLLKTSSKLTTLITKQEKIANSLNTINEFNV